jgi:hypothetical protein
LNFILPNGNYLPFMFGLSEYGASGKKGSGSILRTVTVPVIGFVNSYHTAPEKYL